MVVSPSIRQEFDKKIPYIKVLCQNVREIILNFCTINGFAFTDRIKTIDSLSEKIESGRFMKLSDIEDFYAVSIIIPNLNSEIQVLDFLKATFKKVELKKRGATPKSPDVFRFDNTRFIGKLKQSGEESEISKINFEVQIKTVFEHAWGVSTHALVYKTDEIDWKLYRIAAQLKSSVEQLDLIVIGAKHLSSHITEHHWPEVKIKKFILNKTNEFLANPNVPDELKPKDSSRFSENLYAFLYSSVKDSKKFSIILSPLFIRANEFANNLGFEKFPRSISLVQYFIGIAHELNIDLNSQKYTPLITLEMETIFPNIKNIRMRFIID
jgi:ppGpp synthetase/RelA/SpoT-type nucleotidyltranferase